MEQITPFIAELIALCKKHDATLFARTDGKRQVLSVEIGTHPKRLWLDFEAIDGGGAPKLKPLPLPTTCSEVGKGPGRNCCWVHKPQWVSGAIFVCPDCGRKWEAHKGPHDERMWGYTPC